LGKRFVKSFCRRFARKGGILKKWKLPKKNFGYYLGAVYGMAAEH
jgi:hypothetical protein